MKKRILLIVLAALLLLSATACGKKSLEGKWKLVGAEGSDYAEMEAFGAEIYFVFDNEKVTFEFDFSNSELSEEEQQYAESMLGMMTLIQITYEVKSDTELEMTTSAFGQTETETVQYSLEGDTLTFEGATFERQ